MAPKKYLVVKGVAGLGNRIQTICAALAYAAKTDRNVYVDWSDSLYSNGTNNVFDDYFLAKDHTNQALDLSSLKAFDVYPKIFSGDNISKGVYDLAHYQKLEGLLKCKLWILVTGKILGQKVWVKKNTDLNAWSVWNSKKCFPYGKKVSLNKKAKVLVYVDFLGTSQYDVFFRYYKINPKILLRYKPVWANTDVYGFHIRNTDLKEKGKSIREILLQIDALSSGMRIYLATDDAILRREAKAFFCKRLMHGQFNLPDTNGKGLHHYLMHIEEGKSNSLRNLFIDIISLAHCSRFYGHKGSTMTEFVKYYRLNMNTDNHNGYWNDNQIL